MLGALGMMKLEVRAATVGFGKKYPEFWINLRIDMTRALDAARMSAFARAAPK